MINAKILGDKLYDLRKRLGISQEELADKLNVSRQAISKWERGEALPDTDNLISISKLYGVSLDELVGNAPPKEDCADLHAEGSCEDKSSAESANLCVDVSDGEDDEDDEETYFSQDGKPLDKKRKFLRFLYNVPYPILITVIYLLWGFLGENGWEVGWTLYITIPVYYSVIDCFRKKRLSCFCYPVFVAFVFCFVGMQWDVWHPTWIIFTTIPIFYCVADALK